MAQLKCKCGFIHDLSLIPDDGWVTVKDKDYDEIIEAENYSLNYTEDSEELEKLINTDKFISASKGTLYECPKCERIMWEKPGSNIFETYIKDNS